MIEKLQKGSRFTLGHYGCPLWIINKFCICFHLWMIFGKCWQPLIMNLPFFKVKLLKKQDEYDFKQNLNLFPFLFWCNATATFKRYQPILSKKIGCKTYLSLLNPFLCKNWLVQGNISGSAILKINYWIFSQKIVNSFHKFFENVTILFFSYFLASKPFSHIIFFCLHVVSSHI